MKGKYVIFTLNVLQFWSCTTHSINDLSQPNDIVTYNGQIKLIFEANCISCHGNFNPQGNLSLTNYIQVKNNINNIIDRIQRPQGSLGMMPSGLTRLSEPAITAVIKWRDGGLIE